jgi:hypothetical protein
MTRINKKYTRVYDNGFDISGYANDVGALDWMFSFTPMMAFSDGVMNGINGKAEIKAGTINAFLDNDTAGLFANSYTGQGTQNLMVALGTNAEPVAGQPVFAWKFEQINYKSSGGDGFVPVTVDVNNASYAGILNYSKPWGVLLHPNGAETAANTATGIDDLGASSALGGIFIYHLLSSDGTVTLTAEDASTNSDGDFGAITGATSGGIDATSAPLSGMIALGVTATVKRYLRPQIAFGTASTATYVSAFIRGSY